MFYSKKFLVRLTYWYRVRICRYGLGLVKGWFGRFRVVGRLITFCPKVAYDRQGINGLII